MVSVLTKAYEESKDLKYANRAIEWIERWIVNDDTKMNPNMTYAQTRPGVDKLSPSGIIEARDLVNLVGSLRLLEEKQASLGPRLVCLQRSEASPSCEPDR